MAPTIVKLLESAGRIGELFKDTKGKYSSKRTVSGVLVTIVANDALTNGITWQNLLLAFIAVLPIMMSVFESDGKVQ